MSATRFSEIRDAWLAVHLVEPPANVSESLLLTDKVTAWLARREMPFPPMKPLRKLYRRKSRAKRINIPLDWPAIDPNAKGLITALDMEDRMMAPESFTFFGDR